MCIRDSARTVDPGQQPDLRVERADFIEASAVHPLALLEPVAHHGLLQLIDRLVDDRALLGVLLIEFRMDVLDHRREVLILSLIHI